MPPEPAERYLLVHTLEALADYGVYLRDRRRPQVVRAAGFGIQRIIREMFADVELGHTAKEQDE